MPADRPLLVLPAPARGPAATPPPKIGGGARNPKKARQLERLGPKFEALRVAMEERRAALQTSASGAPLEQVIVFETNGPVQDLMNALHNAPGFSWLGEEMEERDPDVDFQDAKKPSKKLSARLYMIMTNQDAL